MKWILLFYCFKLIKSQNNGALFKHKYILFKSLERVEVVKKIRKEHVFQKRIIRCFQTEDISVLATRSRLVINIFFINFMHAVLQKLSNVFQLFFFMMIGSDLVYFVLNNYSVVTFGTDLSLIL